MSRKNLISNEQNARLELYVEIQKGLQAINEGRTKTAEEVEQHFEERRKKYLNESI